MTKDTGGPAFPTDHFLAQHRDGHFVEQEHPGMTLRDWLAGQALTGILAADAKGVKNTAHADIERVLAAASYSVADAMLAERSKP